MSEQIVLDGEIDADINYFNEAYPSINDNHYNQYFDSSTFNNLQLDNGSNFSVIHLNIRSLKKNGETFEAYLSTLNCKFDVICLTETWSKDIELINDFLDGYSVFSSTRRRNGGGSAIYVKNSFKCSVVSELTVNESYIESVFIKINSPTAQSIIGSVYRPPKNDTLTVSYFISFLGKFSPYITNNSDMIVCGDFNIDLYRVNDVSGPSSLFHETMNSLSLLPVISRPTRISGTSCTLIDNIFVSNLNNFKSGILTIDITDHFPIFLVYKSYLLNHTLQPKKVEYRVFNETTKNCFHNKVMSMNLEDLLSEADVDHATSLLHTKILEAYNDSCPIITKTISVKDQIKP